MKKRWTIVYNYDILNKKRIKGKNMKLESLKTSLVCAESECIKQSWKNTSKWTGYVNTARGNNAFILVCSNMRARFEFKDGKTIIATKGDVVFIPKNTYYCVYFYNVCDDFDSFTINFTLFDGTGKETTIQDAPCVLARKFDEGCLFVTNELFKAYLNKKYDSINYQIQFYSFLDKICNLIDYSSKFYLPIKKGVELLLAEFSENKKMDYYAKQCNMDKSYFYKLFKLWANVSPNEYRNQLRLSTAKSMLKNTNMTICQIAEKTGFVDPYYFSRIFKKEIGLSPLQYRKLVGENGKMQ